MNVKIFRRVSRRVFRLNSGLTCLERVAALGIACGLKAPGVGVCSYRDIAERGAMSMRSVQRAMAALCDGPDRIFARTPTINARGVPCGAYYFQLLRKRAEPGIVLQFRPRTQEPAP